MTFALTSSAFKAGNPIPARHTCSGADLSPPLAWSGASADVKSLALICEDPDAPGGTFYHWGFYDIPPGVTALAEGTGKKSIPAAKLATNSFGSSGYRGPCPPRGHGTHHYHFRLFALSAAKLNVSAGADCRSLLAALEPYVLAEAQLVGTFSR
jgi:Raf kinase inhibitor-like YbhB/YbcL family protein